MKNVVVSSNLQTRCNNYDYITDPTRLKTEKSVSLQRNTSRCWKSNPKLFPAIYLESQFSNLANEIFIKSRNPLVTMKTRISTSKYLVVTKLESYILQNSFAIILNFLNSEGIETFYQLSKV